MNELYEPNEVEQAAQAFWEEQKTFKVSEDLSKEKFYCLSMFPYPSGDLHMGHVRNYTLGDVIARYQRMRGKNVLQPMGWDAFGLPAENAAIKHGIPPAQWTYQNIEHMRAQFKDLGFAYDWSREITTCKPEYYRWEQWLFIKLFEKGLVYKKNAVVNWDPVDHTVLANEQVVNGRGWRSGAIVERREIPQWFLKITAYKEELLNDLDKLEHWPEQVRAMQHNWIGRSEGTEVWFDVPDEQALRVFTTRADTLMGATYLAIAPSHPLTSTIKKTNPHIAEFVEKCLHIRVSEADTATMTKEGLDTGLCALHPISGEQIPIWVCNYVLMEYGTGAVMAVPAHDERDYEFARQFNLPIKQVIVPSDGSDFDIGKHAFVEYGNLINSEQFDGLNSEQAKQKITQYLEKAHHGEPKVQYRLRDWGISRQRYWGAPIPMINCQECGSVPVPEDQLPVCLPEDVSFDQHGSSPLAKMPEFYKTTCPNCQREAKRETDTFDTFMESSWYYARFACHNQDTAILDDRAKYWTPVDQYVGGIEHAVMHLLYARFIHKVLRDEGFLYSDEPFTRLLTQGMVLKDGSKMSKSKGNVVAPKDLIERYGADTVRLFTIFAAPPEQSLEWSDSGVEGAYRFLKRLWLFARTHQTDLVEFNKNAESDTLSGVCRQEVHDDLRQVRCEMYGIFKKAQYDYERLQFNTVVSSAMKLFNLLTKAEPAEGECKQYSIALLHEGFSILLHLLSPIAPHISHVLWRELGFGDDIFQARWPKVIAEALKTEQVSMVIQINGKKRSEISVPIDADESKIQTLTLADPTIQKYVADKEIKKIIVIPKRLVNLVITG